MKTKNVIVNTIDSAGIFYEVLALLRLIKIAFKQLRNDEHAGIPGCACSAQTAIHSPTTCWHCGQACREIPAGIVQYN